MGQEGIYWHSFPILPDKQNILLLFVANVKRHPLLSALLNLITAEDVRGTVRTGDAVGLDEESAPECACSEPRLEMECRFVSSVIRVKA